MRTVMRHTPILAAAAAGTALAAIEIDTEFFERYEPYGQYSAATIRDLAALQEGDLLETSYGTDGVVVRIVGRTSEHSELVSAKIAIDNVARRRLQVKIVPPAVARDPGAAPELRRRPVTSEQARTLLGLLESSGFWNAPYSLDRNEAARAGCADAGAWLLEAVTADRYQIIYRSQCNALDPAAAEIRDFLFELGGV